MKKKTKRRPKPTYNLLPYMLALAFASGAFTSLAGLVIWQSATIHLTIGQAISFLLEVP